MDIKELEITWHRLDLDSVFEFQTFDWSLFEFFYLGFCNSELWWLMNHQGTPFLFHNKPNIVSLIIGLLISFGVINGNWRPQSQIIIETYRKRNGNYYVRKYQMKGYMRSQFQHCWKSHQPWGHSFVHYYIGGAV